MAGWPALREFPCLEMQKLTRKNMLLLFFQGCKFWPIQRDGLKTKTKELFYLLCT